MQIGLLLLLIHTHSFSMLLFTVDNLLDPLATDQLNGWGNVDPIHLSFELSAPGKLPGTTGVNGSFSPVITICFLMG